MEGESLIITHIIFGDTLPDNFFFLLSNQRTYQSPHVHVALNSIILQFRARFSTDYCGSSTLKLPPCPCLVVEVTTSSQYIDKGETWTALNCTALYFTTRLFTALHWTVLDYTSLHCTTLHCTWLHFFALHYTALRCTSLHFTALDYKWLKS